ncbi:putative nicotianamine synthase [Arabidopsis thaliana]|uniref:Nicotianamine synthase n=3 Tax=Arabidopsis TaxID=3701 RepID=F4JUZ6_ARATH|nr:nicotianamine synthase [Arabidopsis thaliana]AEE85207.1 nicotianamine synthase [Arabidopsis thaliana]KAG7617419.1 Nicotianamine synthase [Arabidopsis thaliana x Arabidopsis arenosa]KAG7621886.1 Nicotianamine synthase [Arabidopsis suecica]|eukprot:NP_001190846.1 nicotianamine synthase [Arabidopsis thaliana]
MDPGALLMLRSARGLRSFLYVDVDPCDLKGFEVLEIYHPSMSDGFVNSVMVARKLTDRLIKYEWSRLEPYLWNKADDDFPNEAL